MWHSILKELVSWKTCFCPKQPVFLQQVTRDFVSQMICWFYFQFTIPLRQRRLVGFDCTKQCMVSQLAAWLYPASLILVLVWSKNGSMVPDIKRRCVQQWQARTLIIAVWSQFCHKSKIKLSWQMEYKVRGALWNKIQKGKYLFLFLPPVGCNQFWGTEYKVRGALWNKIQKVKHLFRFLPPAECNQFCEG